MKNFDLVSLGEILIDFTEVRVQGFANSLYEKNTGGAPANVAAAAAKLGAKTAFIGKLGNDTLSHDALKSLQNANVETRGVKIDFEHHTTFSFVSLSENGERSFEFMRNNSADVNLSPDDIDTSLIENARIFHIGSLSCTAEPSRSATQEALKCAKKNGAIISYDPNWRENLWARKNAGIETMKSLFQYADIVKISAEELSLLYGANNSNTAQNILDAGARLVCVTLGKDGVFYKTNNFQGIISIPDYKIQTSDTTGAGDSFLGALLYRMTRRANVLDFSQNEIESDLNFANAAATLCVSRRGAMASLATLSEVDFLLNNRDFA